MIFGDLKKGWMNGWISMFLVAHWPPPLSPVPGHKSYRISVVISLLNLFRLFVFSTQNMDPGQSEQSTVALAENSCCYDYYFACWGRKAVKEFTPYALITSAVCESRKNTGRNDTVSDVWTPSHCSSSEKYVSPIQNLNEPMFLSGGLWYRSLCRQHLNTHCLPC